MSSQLEVELTYLLKYLPKDLEEVERLELFDMYLPITSDHPKLRLRKSGHKMQLVKKNLVSEGDLSVQREQTIELDDDEFNALKQLPGKIVHKIRYKYPYNELTAEIDIFMDDLAGLGVVDFEFSDEASRDRFLIPDFCLAEVTQEKFIAGGLLAGRSYQDIEENLNRYNYKKITSRPKL